MKRKVEFIESYIKVGNDYQWNDNHGELIRCKDCKHHKDEKQGMVYCPHIIDGWVNEECYCSWAEPKETEQC